MSESSSFELFHVVAEAGSAQVRRYVTDHELEAWVRFRNLHDEKARADFIQRGGGQSPALWDGSRLFQGAQACIARLAAHSDIGRTP